MYSVNSLLNQLKAFSFAYFFKQNITLLQLV